MDEDTQSGGTQGGVTDPPAPPAPPQDPPQDPPADEPCAECARLTEELETARAAVPAEGSLVLTPEQRAQYEAFSALSMTPEEIAALQSRVQELESAQAVTEAAASLKWDLPALQFASRGLRVEMRGEGDARAPHVVEGETATPLKDYAEQHWPEKVRESLPAKPASGGTRYPEQSRGGQAPKTNLRKVLEQQYVLPSQRNK